MRRTKTSEKTTLTIDAILKNTNDNLLTPVVLPF